MSIVVVIALAWVVFLVRITLDTKRNTFFEYLPVDIDAYMNINLHSFSSNQSIEYFVYNVLVNNFDLEDVIQAQHLVTYLNNEIVIAQVQKNNQIDTILVAEYKNQEALIGFLNILDDKVSYTFYDGVVEIVSRQFENTMSKGFVLPADISNSLPIYNQKDIYFYIDQKLLQEFGYNSDYSILGGMHTRNEQGGVEIEFERSGDHMDNFYTNKDVLLPDSTLFSYYVPQTFIQNIRIENLDSIGLRDVLGILKNSVKGVRVLVEKKEEKNIFDIHIDIASGKQSGLFQILQDKIRNNVAASFPSSSVEVLPDGTQFNEFFIDPASINIEQVSQNSFFIDVSDSAYELFVEVLPDEVRIRNIKPTDQAFEEDSRSIKELQSRCLSGVFDKQKNVYPYIFVSSDLFDNTKSSLMYLFLGEFDDMLFIDHEDGKIKACFN